MIRKLRLALLIMICFNRYHLHNNQPIDLRKLIS